MNLNKFVFGCLLSATALLTHIGLTASAYAEARSLAAVMKLMGTKLGSVARPVMSGTAGSREAVIAHEILQLVDEAALLLPDFILTLPVVEREAKITRYQELMNQLHVATEELESAIAGSDVSKSQIAFKKMGALKTVGHDEFKL
ncbi:MAG: hypothetical protein K2P81_05615 [Bacteriovoracaceae bacterium]|nr:hypothetical protein [Bacteriovoracaceae bacterium]